MLWTILPNWTSLTSSALLHGFTLLKLQLHSCWIQIMTRLRDYPCRPKVYDQMFQRLRSAQTDTPALGTTDVILNIWLDLTTCSQVIAGRDGNGCEDHDLHQMIRLKMILYWWWAARCWNGTRRPVLTTHYSLAGLMCKWNLFNLLIGLASTNSRRRLSLLALSVTLEFRVAVV